MSGAPLPESAVPAEPCGILCLDKPRGLTSHDLVGEVRRLYGTRRVGHTGTLDPMATGLLVMLIGRATKLSDFLLSGRKRYIAELALGIVTDSQDITGTVLSRWDFGNPLPDPAAVAKVCARFVGEMDQVPPMYSAKKVDGQKLYDLARQGIEIGRAPARITVYSLDAAAIDSEKGLYRLDVICSKGTYIRTLCHDIGQTLGCGGVMTTIRRIQNGAFSVGDAHTPEELESLPPDVRAALLIPPDAAFADLPRLDLPDFYANLASHGCEIYQKKIGTGYPDGTLVRMYGKAGFFALGQVREFPGGSAVKPVRQIGTAG